MSRLISKLPYEIKLKAMEYSNDPGGDDLAASFTWSATDEGYDIWDEIYNNSNYQPFYDHYNMKYPTPEKTTPKQWCEEKGYNEYYVMIIEQYLNDIGK